MALTTTLTLNLNAAHTSSADLSTPTDTLSKILKDTLSSGTGADQADLLFHDQRTLAASTAEDLDLAGVLTDKFGSSLTFARVKAMLFFAAAGNTNNVVIGGKATNAFVNWVSDATDQIELRPGGIFFLWAPDATAYAVTAGTGDILEVENGGGGTSVTYDVVILGASA